MVHSTGECQKGGGEMYVFSAMNLYDSLIPSQDLTSEEIREKRRQERQQFKIDRARALAEAAAAQRRKGRKNMFFTNTSFYCVLRLLEVCSDLFFTD